MKGNLFVLQGGGPTAVINASLAAILAAATGEFKAIFGLAHSFESDPVVRVVDLRAYTDAQERQNLARTPGAILGSSRKMVTAQDLDKLLDVLTQHEAAGLIGIGGNGTMAVLNRIITAAKNANIDLPVCGVPKTVDNDLPLTHMSPGFGSAARFVALAVRDFGYDFRAMATFDDVTILETMGRDSGWLALAANALKAGPQDPPHIVLIPERPVNETDLLEEIRIQHAKHGAVFVVTNEKILDEAGNPLGEASQIGPKDELGRTMWSLSTGVGNFLADRIWQQTGLQTRCLRPGNLGRAMSACVSAPDRALAMQVGQFAVEQMLEGKAAGQMVVVNAELSPGLAPLRAINRARAVPDEFIGSGPDRFTPAYQRYLGPLIGPVDTLSAPLF